MLVVTGGDRVRKEKKKKKFVGCASFEREKKVLSELPVKNRTDRNLWNHSPNPPLPLGRKPFNTNDPLAV